MAHTMRTLTATICMIKRWFCYGLVWLLWPSSERLAINNSRKIDRPDRPHRPTKPNQMTF